MAIGPIVIVGGGTAGSTVALHLASRTARPIVVCEPGALSSHDEHSGFFDVIADDALVTHRLAALTPQTSAQYVQASALGGGSAVNAMLLTGEEPDHVRGLTRLAQPDDMGQVARALLASGGRPARLWWNRGRWNPGRALQHLVEEGRVDLRRHPVTRLHHTDGVISAVECGHEVIQTDCVVLSAGAIASPALLLLSGLADVSPRIGHGLQDHPCITFSLQLKKPEPSRFDATVVREHDLSSGEKGLVVAYERASKHEPHLGLVSVLLMNPLSRGQVALNGERIEVELNLLNDPRDVDVMRDLVRITAFQLLSDEFEEISDSIAGDSRGTNIDQIFDMSDSELDSWIQTSLVPVSHVSSSMHAAVDSVGRVAGATGLVVADASVLAHVPHQTPAAPVTMEALRIARELGERLQ